MAQFSPNPVIEGNSTRAVCSVQDGYPTDIKEVMWRKDGNGVDGKLTDNLNYIW